MASVFVDGKGITKLQFTDVAGERRSMSLAGMKPTQAGLIGERIDSLVNSVISGQPIDRTVAKWLSDLPPRLHKKLVRAGLIAPAETSEQVAALTLGAFADRFIDGRSDVKERTLANYKQTRTKLIEFFGAGRLLSEITQLDVDEWRSWLKGKKKLKENSVRSLVKNAKCMFGAAVKGVLIESNPFQGQKTKVTTVRERMKFIDHDAIRKNFGTLPLAGVESRRRAGPLCRIPHAE